MAVEIAKERRIIYCPLCGCEFEIVEGQSLPMADGEINLESDVYTYVCKECYDIWI